MTLTRRRALALPALGGLAALAGCASPPRDAADRPLGWAGAVVPGDASPTGMPARPGRVFDVHDRAGLDAALRLGDAPKLIRVHALIDLCPGDAEAFRDPAFDADAFDRAFDPATWGRGDPAGPLEDARRRSAQRQARAATVRLPSNTTLVGAAPGAGFTRGMLLLEQVRNVVLRDLHLRDAYDHFPEWQPRDNGHGEWNSAYDNLSLRGARRVWVDHCHFDDGHHPDRLEPQRLGQRVQHHDGLLDITHGSDLVTVSWCRFQGHDKTLLIGGGDARTGDDGLLRVTLHHNHFDACKERTPRVRFGRVHVASNLFSAGHAADFGYSLGVGLRSRLVSDDNAWELPAVIPAHRLLRRLGGSALLDRGNRLNGRPVDLRAAWNAAHPDEPLSADVGWRPEDAYDAAALRTAHPDRLAERIRAEAGPRLR
ncbi:MAG: polysaccharide lyase family 1 protein [Roseateles sp.]|uniref:pectate lyase family protein n=1 Tax=Roseateles sp. TaxID=1971397 RepID=UPI0039EB5CF2